MIDYPGQNIICYVSVKTVGARIRKQFVIYRIKSSDRSEGILRFIEKSSGDVPGKSD